MKTLQLLSITDLHGFPGTENLLLLLCHNNFHCCLRGDNERLDAITGYDESGKDLQHIARAVNSTVSSAYEPALDFTHCTVKKWLQSLKGNTRGHCGALWLYGFLFSRRFFFLRGLHTKLAGSLTPPLS